jgi:phosphatidylethanolamine-binding protein (PEBP) family uncharacterized protein
VSRRRAPQRDRDRSLVVASRFGSESCASLLVVHWPTVAGWKELDIVVGATHSVCGQRKVGMHRLATIGALVLIAGSTGCGAAAVGGATSVPKAGGGRVISLQSPVLTAGNTIPARYSCSGSKVWLPLRWSAVPDDARELVLFIAGSNAVGDGNIAGTFIIGLEPTLRALQVGVLPPGAHSGYVVACPPRVSNRKFYFTLYALSGADRINPYRAQPRVGLLNTLQAVALAEGRLEARYGHIQ